MPDSSHSSSKGLEALAALATATSAATNSSSASVANAALSDGQSSSGTSIAALSPAEVAAALEKAVANGNASLREGSKPIGGSANAGQLLAGLGAANLNPNHLAILAAAGLGSQAATTPAQQATSTDPKVLLAMQNLAYYQMLQLQGGNKQQQQFPDQNQALAAALGSQPGDKASHDAVKAAVAASLAKMPPPPPPQAQQQHTSLIHPAIAPQPDQEINRTGAASGTLEAAIHSKKQQKRAANRRSAQLSRKRKKQFVEELKEENDDLRRKEQILMSIPDLVVVFDSSGKLWFVSQSVERFLDFTADELRGTSFWDRICEDSMRLLKAAFMDSLAARTPDSDTAPLGSGLWELRLVDKDGRQKIVTLNGVVHFAGDRPECVCSMRPRDEVKKKNSTESGSSTSAAPTITESSKSQLPISCVDPRQSAIPGTIKSLSAPAAEAAAATASAVRISDSGNSSTGDGSSESGSTD